MHQNLRVGYLWQAIRRHVREGSGWRTKGLLRTLLDIEPGNAEARLLLGEVLYNEGDIDGALTQLVFARELNPTLADVNQKLSSLFFASGLIALALQCYEKLRELGLAGPALLERIERCKVALAEERSEDPAVMQ